MWTEAAIRHREHVFLDAVHARYTREGTVHENARHGVLKRRTFGEREDGRATFAFWTVYTATFDPTEQNVSRASSYGSVVVAARGTGHARRYEKKKSETSKYERSDKCASFFKVGMTTKHRPADMEKFSGSIKEAWYI